MQAFGGCLMLFALSTAAAAGLYFIASPVVAWAIVAVGLLIDYRKGK